MDYKVTIGTKDNPLTLKTPPLTSEYTMHVEDKEDREILIPALKSVVRSIDIGQKIMRVELPDGLDAV